MTIARGRQVVLRGLDLAVAPGRIVALFGNNGSGKTTLLHCLAGLLRPSAGKVFWFGEAAASSPAARRLIGFLGHETGLYPTLTARENLRFAGRMTGVDRPDERAAELLQATGLQRHADQRPGQLSRGMRQRLAIARAVLHDPPLLLLDEPFTNLDQVSRDWLVRFLESARNRGRAVLFSSHDAELGHSLADRCYCLHAGRCNASESRMGGNA